MQKVLQKLLDKQDLTHSEMCAIMRNIMSGDATSAQIGGFLVALRLKGETVDEITAAASVMREMATKVKVSGEHVVDTCGTGGDASSTFNISTAAAFVVAAAGAIVPKHGNRSVSSRSGSADVLEAAGVNLELTPNQVEQCIQELGVGFLFAPRHHGAMKHALGPRRELGVRTLFNLLGPLSNPAGAPNQLVGVYSKGWVEPLANVLQNLGSQHVLVVHSEDGLDEISIAAPCYVAELNSDSITTYTVTPEQFGFDRTPSLSSLAVNNAESSLRIINAVLNNKGGSAQDIVALNAGAAIFAANLEANLAEGIKRAQLVIADGSALDKFQGLIEFSRSFS
ncbi:MAG: anthranilate phosphoribosyltransferase [Methylococcales bacterium]